MSFIQKIFFNFIIPVVIVGLVFGFPVFRVNFDINTILTVVSLIFAILMGFFIATTTTNYLKLQTLLSNEDSCLINIFDLIKIIQPNACEILCGKIDYYVTRSLDFSISEYVEKTQKEFNDILVSINNLSPNDEKGMTIFQLLHEKKAELLQSRQEITFAAQKIIMPSHWFILVLLAVLIIGMVFAMRDGTVLLSAIVSMISLAIYFVFLLLYKVDNNIFLEEQLSYQNSQKVFSALGTLKYYPYEAIKNKKIKKPKGSYRIGRYNSQKIGATRDTVVVNV